jgi:ribosomal protein S7
MFSRRGSAVAVTTVRGVQVGIKWIIEGAQKRPEKTFQEKLYKELLSVSENQGYASKKKHSWYVLCQKAFLKAIKD